MSLSGIDVRVLTHELESQIIGSWIVNIYHLPSGIFIFKLRKPEVGLHHLLIEPGKRIHLTQFNRTMPKTPSNQGKTLRSHLKEKRINSVTQRELDRIVELNIGPDDGFNLVAELFGHGNLILVSPENKIISALRYRKMRDRDIHPGRLFEQMPSQERDILRHGTEDLDKYLHQNNKLVNALNQWVGLGPKYSRLIVADLGLKKTKIEELTNDHKKSIVEYVENLKDRILAHDYSPVVILDSEDTSEYTERIKDEIVEDEKISEIDEANYDDQWEDNSLAFNPENVLKFQPWLQTQPEPEMHVLELETLSEIVDIFHSSQETNTIVEGDTEELETEVERLERLMSQQKSHQNDLLKKAAELRIQGDLLYANFQPGTELIETVYSARRNNMDWGDIEERLNLGKTKNIASAVIFDSLEPKNAKLVMSLKLDPESSDTPTMVKVDFRKSLADNSNGHYQEAKKSEKKARGADIAIEHTLQKINKAKQKVDSSIVEITNQVSLLKRRKSWYEKFHWTISEAGKLIIAGTDASTNERIVKRYLDGDDVFLHADVQGAPAVVVKAEGGTVSEKTFETAAQLAVVYSSSWKAKQVEVDAFYVEPDQVSFTPPSGEYLPKGSFMIYGTKNYIRKNQMELVLGVIIESNWAKLMVGFEYLKENCDYWVKLRPGDIQRGSCAKMIKAKFQSMADEFETQKIKVIDLGEFASMLPGDCTIVEYSS